MTEPGVGHKFPARKVSWLKRDVLLFNISIGCKADEPQYVYENHDNFSVFPTMPLGLVFKLDTQEVVDFYASQGSVEIPGVPALDPQRLVDGDRTVQLLKPLPTTSVGRDFEFQSTVLGVYDKGKAGTVVRSEDVLVDTTSGDIYARIIGSLFYVGQGNWGGPRGPPSQKFPPPKKQKPDATFDMRINEQAGHLLNGDYNPLHAIPEVGEKLGYGGMIMHGVFAYNMIAHEIVRELGGGDPSSLYEISARFAGPVRPGDHLEVELWRMGTTTDGWEDIRWRAMVAGTRKPCLTEGRASVRAAKLPSRI
ncbi:hypothetical protein AJ80_07616 [Polytolypa hystricis UAMH7299]|uniref:Uncharacterized protein n=1 Tax=Polytolypa hystricis (strain UAMH7299) TaxID=1447883 RepID=A0A2B7XL66_POLH7|nr:hypothetical protein AJ80_07616 [Polytolypa hystricis UAMH7299]